MIATTSSTCRTPPSVVVVIIPRNHNSRQTKTIISSIAFPPPAEMHDGCQNPEPEHPKSIDADRGAERDEHHPDDGDDDAGDARPRMPVQEADARNQSGQRQYQQ